ncbi:MAG: CoA pyrophosphatase [bacterium]|nr:CoA pyrophosphatase [bacterium]
MTIEDPDPLVLEGIRSQIVSHEPSLVPSPAETRGHAAVALVLHEPEDGSGPELLFIERAVREGDPWSGQMAFPGGRRDIIDATMGHTAQRETLEEVGVDLATPIGRLDDVMGGPKSPKPAQIVISSYVYELPERPTIIANHEVQSAVWVPLSWILHRDSSHDYRFERAGFSGSYSSFRYQGYTVWGLTYRVLELFFDVVGRQMPPRR